MPGRLRKFLLLLLAAALLTGASVVQRDLTRQRDELGLTRYTELKGAPPLLTLTTVALGGFRGLISNLLWIRASDLQDDGKFFEMVQLADWITKLEPHFTQVWLNQAWNMAYNISVKFKDAKDRWRWVQRGIELLRDDGLRYNPHDVLIHRELAWFFQHKMGANLDDAHQYYKMMWAAQMTNVFGLGIARPNWDELIKPTTAEWTNRSELLRNKFKMDPAVMKLVDERYGPMEWRLPEAHAIYWAYQGLEEAKRNERKIDPNDLITLRRVIYQSMQLSFQRGRLIQPTPDPKNFIYGQNLAIIPKVDAAYVQAMEEDEKNRDHIETAHRNFLRDAVFYLYTNNRTKDAEQWFKYMGEKYPKKLLLDGQPGSLPGHIDLFDYAVGRLEEEAASPGLDKVKAIIEGLIATSYENLAMGESEKAIGFDNMAKKLWLKYKESIAGDAEKRVDIAPMEKIRADVLKQLLNGGLPPILAAQLRSALGMKADETPPPTDTPEQALPSTNAPPAELKVK